MLKLLWPIVFGICINLGVSLASGFDENSNNLGSGINFYEEMPDTCDFRRPEVLIFEPSDCSKNGGSSFFNDPHLCCEAAEPIPCDYSCPYRKYNGSCNNPHISRLGMSDICYLRLTPTYYEGIGDVRKSVTGDPLPTPRDISVTILQDCHQPTRDVSLLFTTHGQIIAHDVTRAPGPQMDCCKSENVKQAECSMVISVRPDDPFYSQFNKTCLTFQRSNQCTHCPTVHRAQKNSATSALDANIVYGTSEEEVMQLRANDGTGELKSTDEHEGYLLPSGKDKRDPFCPKGQDSSCFRAGDPRVNMHTSLTSLQTIYMRQHNKIAKELKKRNPHWGEEKLFQEARKIMIALHQCITYKEYLPTLVGPEIVDLFDLTVTDGSGGTTYNPQVVLGESQEHAVAAFRVHTMVPTRIGVSGFRFKDTYSNPSMIRNGYILNLTSGSYQVPSEEYDGWMVTDLTDYFAQQPGKPFGTDLSAIDIQRGRDHGLAPYVEVVKFCSGGSIIISSWEDLYAFSLMPRKNIMLLEDTYSDVKDVDMLVGMLMEYHYPGSLLGPSATCINVIQFYSLQKGDRFYFDHEGPDAPFTPEQRSALKQCSIARILCDNTKITHITRKPYHGPSFDNPDVPCEQIPKIDLSSWKEL